MSIPWSWLYDEISPDVAEAELADLGAPESWLQGWRKLLNLMVPGDELWEYFGREDRDSIEPSAVDIPGFEQIVDADFLERIGSIESWERVDRYREGFAVIRGDEVVDWIEKPL